MNRMIVYFRHKGPNSNKIGTEVAKNDELARTEK